MLMQMFLNLSCSAACCFSLLEMGLARVRMARETIFTVAIADAGEARSSWRRYPLEVRAVRAQAMVVQEREGAWKGGSE